MKLINKFLLVFITSISYAQVGIGTTTPTSELEIETTNTGIPALELNPQSAPVGSADGQISVIGDKIYMYDDMRSKWLSVSTLSFDFGRSGDVGTQNLRSQGNITSANTGTLMPYNGTIIAITANSNTGSGTTNLSKEFNFRIRNGNTTQGAAIDFSLSGGTYTDLLTNRDFNAGDHFHIRARDPDSSGDVVNNPIVTIWVKWRQ